MTETASIPSVADLTHPDRPRSNHYDPSWIVENQMGAHPLWLLEWLAPALGLDALRPGARVLDLGCGRALTSVFLAREYDLQVTAVDPLIAPDDNARRIADAGFTDRVQAVRADARELPFSEGSFDAIVSVDAFQGFGADDLYLPTLTRLLKPGGRIGVVVPALREELPGSEPPAHLAANWRPAYWAYHSAAWWRRNWERTGAVVVEGAEWQEEGWRDWLRWSEVFAATCERARETAELLRVDEGRALGFVRVVGRRR